MNQNLEEQFHRANETQEFQVEAMQDMAQANFQMKFDHMFAGVPMYDGTDPDSFDDWLYQIKSLCEVSHRDVRVELMGRASAQVKQIIRSLPVDIEWEIAQRELKRCLAEEKSRAYSAFKLVQIKQKPNENLRIFIPRYQDLHTAATGKTAADDTDPTHIIRFLGMMTNSEIVRKITQKGIPKGMTLGQAFTWAIELEAGYQLSEGVSLARPPEIMQVQEIEEVDANCFLLVFAVSGPFTSRLAVCICFSWFSRSEVCAFVWGIFVRGLRVETFVRVLRSSRCRL